MSDRPTLIEPGVKSFLNETLKQCHQFKMKYYNQLFNFALFFAFVFVLSCVLLYKYKGKLTPSEKYKKEKQKQQYILSKIKNYQDAKKIARQELITGLPQWEKTF